MQKASRGTVPSLLAVVCLTSALIVANPSAASARCYGTTAGGRVDNDTHLKPAKVETVMSAVDLGGECNSGQLYYHLAPRRNSEDMGLTDADTYYDNKNYIAHDGNVIAAGYLWGNRKKSIGGKSIDCRNGYSGNRLFEVDCR